MTRIFKEFFFIVLFFRFGILLCSPEVPIFYECDPDRTKNINLQSNLNYLFKTLNSTTYSSNIDFANTTIKAGTPNQLNGLIMCYIDSNQHDCLECLNVSLTNATVLCPNSSTATFTYLSCFLRYSNENFIEALNIHQNPHFYHNLNYVSNSSTLNGTVSELLNSLRLEAMSSKLLYANGNKTDPGINQTVFGLVQCTRDLNKDDCGLCLQSTIGKLTSYVTHNPYKGVRVSSTSCYIRFELYPLFYHTFKSLAPAPGPSSPNSPPPFNPALRGTAQPPQIPNNESGTSSELLSKIVGVSVATIAATLVIAAGGIWLWRRQSIASTASKCPLSKCK